MRVNAAKFLRSHLIAGSFSDVVVDDEADESGDCSRGGGEAWSEWEGHTEHHLSITRENP